MKIDEDTLLGFFLFTVIAFLFGLAVFALLASAVSKYPELSIAIAIIVVGSFILLRGYKKKREKEKRQAHLKRMATLGNMKTLSGVEFENLVADYFREQGYKVEMTPASGDTGVDIFLNDKQYMVQCKNQRADVSQPKIRDFFGAMTYYKAERGFFITTAGFTKPAKDFASKTPIELINGEDLTNQLIIESQK